MGLYVIDFDNGTIKNPLEEYFNRHIAGIYHIDIEQIRNSVYNQSYNANDYEETDKYAPCLKDSIW